MDPKLLIEHVKLCKRNLRSTKVKCCATCPFEEEIVTYYPELGVMFDNKRKQINCRVSKETLVEVLEEKLMEPRYSSILNQIQSDNELIEIRCAGETDYYRGYIVFYDSDFIRLNSVNGKIYLIVRANIRRIQVIPATT